MLLVCIVSGQVRGPCTGRPVGFFQADPAQCNAYFACGPNGVATRDTCPAPFMFRQDRQKCDWPENVNCFQCDETAAYQNTPVANSCIHFVRCVRLIPSLEVCPSGLMFDKKVGQCNIAALVDCTVEDVNRCLDPNNPEFFADENDCNRFVFQ